VLLNWLGREGQDAAERGHRGGRGVDAARSHGGGHRDRSRLQSDLHSNFLGTLKPKSFAMARRFEGLLDVARVRRARTMYDFDDAVTAVLHDFAGAEDYWRRASAKPWLAGVGVPTLV
jgi:predicted alpha/beta-fold hydrolase